MLPTRRRKACWPNCARITEAPAKRLREAHGMIDEHNDVATTSLLEVFIDETERRAWFLDQTSHAAPHAT